MIFLTGCGGGDDGSLLAGYNGLGYVYSMDSGNVDDGASTYILYRADTGYTDMGETGSIKRFHKILGDIDTPSNSNFLWAVDWPAAYSTVIVGATSGVERKEQVIQNNVSFRHLRMSVSGGASGDGWTLYSLIARYSVERPD